MAGEKNAIEKAGAWLGVNRAMLGVLLATGGFGLSEEIWHNYFALDIKQITGSVRNAVLYVAVHGMIVNLLEGFGYIIGGTVAHKMGARVALAVSSLPMLAGFGIMLIAPNPWVLVLGALLITNWEPLSVPAAFDVVGAEVPKNRRNIAFAVASIQKRIPKVIGPLLGALAFSYGYKINLLMALAVLGVAIAAQMILLDRMKPRPLPPPVPIRQVLREIPPELRALLNAEILLRWGDWFVRDFAALYVVGVLQQSHHVYGELAALTAATALVTYIPAGKLIDWSGKPKIFVGITFFLFASFPFCLVLLPRYLPVGVALVIAFVVNGLRETGEPARKAMIASGFPDSIRARAVGLYWGLRSFGFFLSPIVAYFIWQKWGPDATFLAGGTIGMIGTALFWMRVK